MPLQRRLATAALTRFGITFLKDTGAPKNGVLFLWLFHCVIAAFSKRYEQHQDTSQGACAFFADDIGIFAQNSTLIKQALDAAVAIVPEKAV